MAPFFYPITQLSFSFVIHNDILCLEIHLKNHTSPYNYLFFLRKKKNFFFVSRIYRN